MVIETRTVSLPTDEVVLACGKCDSAFRAPFSRLLIVELDRLDGRPAILLCGGCNTVPTVFKPTPRGKWMGPTSERGKGPATEASAKVLAIFDTVPTIAEKEKLISTAAAKVGMTTQAAERVFFRWVTYPLAKDAEQRIYSLILQNEQLKARIHELESKQ